ncbi:hypothetical protein BRC81_00045 [Halobacteriales archaeon QS_1_68_20]|nr:MAG: hypothetical protein BRC81_00045 [Halobacteriales archaeon QS_1_68_20]
MSCPVHNDDGSTDDERDGDDRGIDRREFVRSALVIGGSGAIGSLGSIAGITPTVAAEDHAPISAAERQNRQHAWDAYEPTAASGNTPPPSNSLFLMLDLESAGTPAWDERLEVKRALREIEHNFTWGPDGVLFTMAYSASYFDRYDENPPAGASPDDAQTVVDTVANLTDLADTNDDVTPDVYDAALLLASDNEANLLAVEDALWGGDGDLTFENTFEGIFAKPEEWPGRRVGFSGPAFQERELDYEQDFLEDGQDIPDEAPLSMGFIAGFGDSIPLEDDVTLERGQRFPNPTLDASEVPDLPYVGSVGERDPGVFAQGTLKHISHVELDLSEWYGNEPDRRRNQMYSPYHDEAETNDMGGDKPGSGLTDADANDPNTVGPDDDVYEVMEYAARTEDTASGDVPSDEVQPETDKPTAGHSQKAARARYDVDGDGDREQTVLRRDWDTVSPTAANGEDTAGYVFNVPMRFDESVYSMLDANYNVKFTSLDGSIDHGSVDNEKIDERNGIAPYMTATRRSNWLVPPVTLRALPFPQAEQASMSVSESLGTYTVEVSGYDADGGRLAIDTVQFGSPDVVDRGRGASPDTAVQSDGSAIFEFVVGDVDLSEGDVAKLFAKKQDSREPVVGETTV